MSITQLLFAGYANPLVAVDSAQFDGTNDYMLRGSDLSGNADSKSGIISVWVRLDGGDGTYMRIFCGSNSLVTALTDFILEREIGNTFAVTARNAAVTTILLIRTVATYVASSTWLHVLASWDLAAGTNNLYINDVSDKSIVTNTNDTIDYTEADYVVGASELGTLKLNGCLAELYFAPGQYLDFSNVYNRRKFISASGKPVSLGANGALPTGVAPIVYEHLNVGELASDFAVNLGTGGGFTVNGSLTTGSTSPSS